MHVISAKLDGGDKTIVTIHYIAAFQEYRRSKWFFLTCIIQLYLECANFYCIGHIERFHWSKKLCDNLGQYTIRWF